MSRSLTMLLDFEKIRMILIVLSLKSLVKDLLTFLIKESDVGLIKDIYFTNSW